MDSLAQWLDLSDRHIIAFAVFGFLVVMIAMAASRKDLLAFAGLVVIGIVLTVIPALAVWHIAVEGTLDRVTAAWAFVFACIAGALFKKAYDRGRAIYCG